MEEIRKNRKNWEEKVKIRKALSFCLRSYFTYPPYLKRYDTYFSDIMLNDILSMLKRLKTDIAVFVFGQLDPIFLCVAAIHALKDYNDFPLCLFKTSLIILLKY